MSSPLIYGLAEGVRRLERWRPLLDRINVFPVADGDTGRNLWLSLRPLLDGDAGRNDLGQVLLMAARGNSGNLATQFLSAWLEADDLMSLPETVTAGCSRAQAAIGDPQPGTMLTLFDAFREALYVSPPADAAAWAPIAIERLSEAVLGTILQQPRLREAGVVDAGALGMWIVLETFLRQYRNEHLPLPSLAQRFGAHLRLRSDWTPAPEGGFCIDAVIQRPDGPHAAALGSLGTSLVTIPHGGLMKVHVHAECVAEVRQKLEAMGEVLELQSDDLGAQSREFAVARSSGRVQLLTDAAGTFTADDAARHAVIVLDSYIQLDEGSIPESKLPPSRLYQALAGGARITTSQASNQERQDSYRTALGSSTPVLYLAVGSAYTGNVEVATRFATDEGCLDRFRVVDSGAASGRLGIVVLATARFLRQGADLDEAELFARSALALAREWVFIDQLKFLARGGRLSRTAAFFGDALRMKPVISPQPNGAEKVGVVRQTQDQLPFLLDQLGAIPEAERPRLMLLQHTDNEQRLREEILPVLSSRYAGTEIRIRRMSLTSGVHMGPGTWALACLPALSGFESQPWQKHEP